MKGGFDLAKLVFSYFQKCRSLKIYLISNFRARPILVLRLLLFILIWLSLILSALRGVVNFILMVVTIMVLLIRFFMEHLAVAAFLALGYWTLVYLLYLWLIIFEVIELAKCEFGLVESQLDFLHDDVFYNSFINRIEFNQNLCLAVVAMVIELGITLLKVRFKLLDSLLL